MLRFIHFSPPLLHSHSDVITVARATLKFNSLSDQLETKSNAADSVIPVWEVRNGTHSPCCLVSMSDAQVSFTTNNNKKNALWVNNDRPHGQLHRSSGQSVCQVSLDVTRAGPVPGRSLQREPMSARSFNVVNLLRAQEAALGGHNEDATATKVQKINVFVGGGEIFSFSLLKNKQTGT